MEKHENIHKNWKEIFVNNFIGGIAWGLGGTVGAAIILSLLGLFLSKVNLVPFIGTFVSEVANFVLKNNP